MKKAKHNPILQAAYIEAVETQLRENNPPETRETFDRLRSEGFTEKDAKKLIASVIAVESFEVLKSQSPFNKERFVRNLKRLPDQSFIDE